MIYVSSSINYIVYVFIIYFLDCNLSGVRGREKETPKREGFSIPSMDAAVSIDYTFLSVSKKETVSCTSQFRLAHICCNWVCWFFLLSVLEAIRHRVLQSSPPLNTFIILLLSFRDILAHLLCADLFAD